MTQVFFVMCIETLTFLDGLSVQKLIIDEME